MASRIIVDIVNNYCEINNISLDLLSSDWILKLTKNNIIKFIHGYQFDLNSAGTIMICNDKCATSDILELNRVSNVRHNLILPELNITKSNLANLLFKKYNEKVVLKTNNGSGGKDVYLISSFDELIKKIQYLFNKKQYAAICPFYEITNEYRVIILNGEIKLIYSKLRTSSWKHNLGLGAEPLIISDKTICDKLSSLALAGCNAVNGKFVAVDIIEVNGEYMILEINSGIMMEYFASKCPENYKISEKIYFEALDSMFSN